MLDVQTILAQVAHNGDHEKWMIAKAKDNTKAVVIPCAIMVILFGFPIFVLFTLCIPYLFGYSNDSPFPLLLSEPWLALPSLFIWTWFLLMVRRSEKNKSDALLILLPEGIITCNRWSNEEERKIKSIAYADLETMELQILGGRIVFPIAQTRDMSLEEYIEHGQLATYIFKLVYHSGKKEEWTIPSEYYKKYHRKLEENQREEGELAKRIVTDYAAFVHNRS